MRAKPTAHKKPNWGPRVSEGIIESLATLPPEKRFYTNIFREAGYNTDHEVFEALGAEGILEYSGDDVIVEGGSGSRKHVTLTREGAEYVLECVSARLPVLRAVQKGLIAEIARLSIEQSDQD